MQAAHGLVKQRQEKEEFDEFAERHGATHHPSAADPQNQDAAQRRGEAHRRRVTGPDAHDAERAAAQVIGALREPLVFVGELVVSLDLADALEVVHKERVHGAGRFALRAIAPVRRQRVPECACGKQRERNHRHQGQRRIQPEEECGHPHHAEQRHGALLRAVDEDALDRIHVFDDARHQVTRGARVEVAHRQPLEPRVHVPAHVVDDILLEGIVDADAQAVEQVTQQEGAQQAEHDPRELVRLPLADDLIDDLPREMRKGEAACRRQYRAKHRSHGHPPIRRQVDRHAPDHFPRRAGLGFEGRVGAGGNGMGAIGHRRESRT